MKYQVIQKIKALGLQVGDIFEKEGKSWIRIYKTGAKIIVPDYIIENHPDWFEKLSDHTHICPHKTKTKTILEQINKLKQATGDSEFDSIYNEALEDASLIIKNKI